MVSTTSSSVVGEVGRPGADREPAAERPAVRQPGRRPSRASVSASTPTSTKSAQYAPQISGGNGRNVNYIVDGGDNNDDTVGGLLQMFPLEAIQEFNVHDAALRRRIRPQQRRRPQRRHQERHQPACAAAGSRSFRDDALNARTETRAEREGRQAGVPAATSSAAASAARSSQNRVALLRRLRAHAAGHQAGGRHARAVPGRRRGLRRAVPREPVHRQG